MTTLEKTGLEILMGLLRRHGIEYEPKAVASVNAAIDWIHRQIAIDAKRRRKRK